MIVTNHPTRIELLQTERPKEDNCDLPTYLHSTAPLIPTYWNCEPWVFHTVPQATSDVASMARTDPYNNGDRRNRRCKLGSLDGELSISQPTSCFRLRIPNQVESPTGGSCGFLQDELSLVTHSGTGNRVDDWKARGMVLLIGEEFCNPSWACLGVGRSQRSCLRATRGNGSLLQHAESNPSLFHLWCRCRTSVVRKEC